MKKSKNLLDLTFKIPSNQDCRIKTKYHPLSPKQYLDFIGCGVKFTPNLKATLVKLKQHKPKVKFKL